MARNEPIAVGDTWTQLTAGDVTAITFENLGNDVTIMVTVGAVAPTLLSGLVYPPKTGESNIALSALMPGVSGGNRVYARADYGSSVWVSHA